MDQREPLDLLLRIEGERTLLCAPEVGYYTRAVELGRVLTAGEEAGILISLGRVRSLCVPVGAAGVVRTPPPERVHHPVGYGDVLIELAAVEGGATLGASPELAGEAGGALLLRSESPGRFWHRSAPGEPALVQPGEVIEDGSAVGLIEVMKTFAQVIYRARGGLPARARVLRAVAADGADVSHGDALFELEPA